MMRSLRFAELHPDLIKYLFKVGKDSLTFATDTNQEAAELVPKTNLLLQEGAMIFGTTSIEILCCGDFVFAADLELQSIDVANETRSMQATATATKNTRAIEFEVSSQPQPTQIIPWTEIAPRIMADEAELKRQLAGDRIPFLWAVNGEWGIEEGEAILLIQNFYQARATQEIASMRGGVPSVSPEVARDTQKKTSKPKASAIKLVGEYKPTKNLFDSSRRYLNAIAPENPDTQMQILEEIIAGEARGKKHIELALSGYEEGKAPTKVELTAAFVRLRDRMKKEKHSPATGEALTEATSEESQN